MKFSAIVVLCFSCVNFTFSVKNTYKAAVVHKDVDASRYNSLIQEAAKSNVDILVVPSLQMISENLISAIDNYNEAVKTLSIAAKDGRLYIVAHLYEKTRCQNRNEIIRSNLVFDREGTIISVRRKSINNISNCTVSPPDVTTFTTDFGVTFGLLMEEDIVLQNVENMKNLRNFVVTGAWSSEIPFLSAPQFSLPWAFVVNANLISSSGIFTGQSGARGTGSQFIVADLDMDGGSAHATTPVVVTKSPGEDLSQYIIKPLDLDVSARGHTETVCHETFCCEFTLKTKSETKNELSYGLAAFNGVRYLGRGLTIGVQSCAVVACAGLYKRTCAIGSINSTTHFENIAITGNFAKSNSAQFPIILSSSNIEDFEFDVAPTEDSQRVTIKATDAKNIMNFGIFGRDFSRDFESDYVGQEKSDIYDYFYNEDVKEFFDYVWIRIRILIFVVSIYILEMM